MKIALASMQVPFVYGGAEILIKNLKHQLEEYGHQVESILIPFKWYPPENIIDQMLFCRSLSFNDSAYQKIDLMIGLKFPAYYIKHDNKKLWLVHQHRQAYDLYETKYGDLHNTKSGKKVAKFIKDTDSKLLNEYSHRFTISQNVSNRLQTYNNLSSVPLYHPPEGFEKYKCSDFENFIFYPSRIDQLKRQSILVKSAKYIKNDIKILIAGDGDPHELDKINKFIVENNLQKKVQLLGRITLEKKIDLFSRCLAVFFGCYDEDYGYVALEALYSKKPLIVFEDAGGPLDFVIHGKSGFVLKNDPIELAKSIDMLFEQKKAAEMGEEGHKLLKEKNVNWEQVIASLLK